MSYLFSFLLSHCFDFSSISFIILKNVSLKLSLFSGLILINIKLPIKSTKDIKTLLRNFFKFFLTKNEYDYGHINDNAVSVIKELNEKYEVFIGTSFIFREIVSDSGIFVKNKYDFLMKNFPFLDPMNFVFVGNKSILKCDIFIDDKIENLTGGDIKILYTAYHNKSISDEELKKLGIIRAKDWLDIKRILIDNMEV